MCFPYVFFFLCFKEIIVGELALPMCEAPEQLLGLEISLKSITVSWYFIR